VGRARLLEPPTDHVCGRRPAPDVLGPSSRLAMASCAMPFKGRAGLPRAPV
jgi:hypothetical protein